MARWKDSMDRQAAVKVIKDTFENSFDKGRFINLSKNLVKYLDSSKNFTYQGNIIPAAYQQSIQTLERVGKYEDADDNKIDALIVRLKKEHSLERARTMQRNFVAWYLNGSRGGELKDAALVAFVSPESEDWRFSLVRMDYNIAESPSGKVKVETELTPARRYSFLVGENESSHTAQVQLLGILQDDERKPLLSDFEKAFSIEVVNREFLNKYRELFHKVEETLQGLIEQNKRIREDFEAKCVDMVNFAKKLLGQIVFLYFLQKKGWLGVAGNDTWGQGDKRFLRSLFVKCGIERKNFFNDFLEYLFYDALNREDRGSVDPSFYNRFNCKIPFLNGGLFDPINNYDWVHTDILLPNGLFSNNEKTKEGDVGTGILDVFDRYNFTVKEDEPLDKEVAVDPEMLGKVFENLLEVKDRKSKGNYYTPREIVHYMCQESLINYLDTAINTGEVPLVTTPPPQGKLFGKPDPEQGALKAPGYRAIVPREDIEALVRRGELAIEHDTRVEAYGKETERYSYKLPESIRWNAKLIDDKLAGILVCDPAIGSGAFPVGLMTEIVRARNTLTTYLPDKDDRTNYNFKRHAIQSCLYGVDIDAGAVEIAKLRLWLSLVVDEEDIKQIQPLPNLDYKIVCGNSLLGVERRLENWQLFQKLEELKPLYFSETNAKKKQEFRKQIDQLIRQLTNDNETFDFEVYFSEVFHEKGGFDVVMANPPYVRVQHMAYSEIDSYKALFKSAYKRIDLSIVFIELALRLLNRFGSATYITSSQFTKTEYGRNIRQILKDALISMIYFGDCQIFQKAINYTSVFLFSKAKLDLFFSFSNAEQYDGNVDLNDFVSAHHALIDRTNLNPDGWHLAEDEKIRVINKLMLNPTKLENISDIEYGLVTGLDKVMVLNANDKRLPLHSMYVYPLVRPSETNRYHVSEPDNYVIYPYKSINRNTQIVSEGELEDNAPALYRYLLNNKASLLSRKDSRKECDEGSKAWFGLMRHSSFQKVAREKILIQALCKENEFCLDTKGYFFTGGSIYSICSNTSTISNLVLLGVLNSKVAQFYYQIVCPIRQNGYRFYAGTFLKTLPIPEKLHLYSAEIKACVDKILTITKGEDYLESEAKQAKVRELEHQIDQMVYELYGLTPEEIAVVEGINKK